METGRYVYDTLFSLKKIPQLKKNKPKPGIPIHGIVLKKEKKRNQ